MYTEPRASRHELRGGKSEGTSRASLTGNVGETQKPETSLADLPAISTEITNLACCH